MTWQQLENIPVAIYEPGMWFGEFEVYKNMQRLFSCWAKTDVELFALDKKQFKQIFFKSFPGFGKYFVRKMDKNFENLENTMQAIIDYVYPEMIDAEIEKQFEFIQKKGKEFSKFGRDNSSNQPKNRKLLNIDQGNQKMRNEKSRASLEKKKRNSNFSDQKLNNKNAEKDSPKIENLSKIFVKKTVLQNEHEKIKKINEIQSNEDDFLHLNNKLKITDTKLKFWNYNFKESIHQIQIPKTPLMLSKSKKNVQIPIV